MSCCSTAKRRRRQCKLDKRYRGQKHSTSRRYEYKMGVGWVRMK